MMEFATNVLKVFGIVFLRFRAVPRVWCVWLVGVNLGCLYFISEVEGQVVLITTGLAVVVQTLIYGRFGFIRMLGIVHLAWLPMFAWIFSRWDIIQSDHDLRAWLICLAATNAVSLAVDVVDALRFAHGERAPYYSWDR